MFRRRLLPMAWVVCTVGIAGLLVAAGHYLIYDEWPYHYAGLFAALAVLPFVLLGVGWLRGHNNHRIEEP